MLNIYFFADKLPPKYTGGVEIHGQAFIDYFSSRSEFELKIITKDEQQNDYLKCGNALKRINIFDLDFTDNTIFFFNSGYWIEDLNLLKETYPSVLFYYRTGGNEIFSAQLKDLSLPYETRLNYWVSTLNENIEYLITNSFFTENRLRGIGINPGLFYRVVGGVNEFSYNSKNTIQFKAVENVINVVCIARLVQYKGVSELIDIIGSCDNMYLHIIGDGPLKDSLLKYSEKYSNIDFLGQLSNLDSINILRKCDIYAQCSKDIDKSVPGGSYIHTEGMGRTILESIVSKIPIVAYNSGALSELITSDVGILVEPGNYNEFRLAINNLYYKKELFRNNYEKYYFSKYFSKYVELFNKEKYLIVTSKFPYNNNDIDGGNLLVDKLYKLLKEKVTLDICFTREKNINIDLDNHKILYLPNNIQDNNKFRRRIKNYKNYANSIKMILKHYHRVIYIHVSKLFGLSKEDLTNGILFPMFLTPSYIESTEIVPKEYTLLESKHIKNIDLILTPSKIEYNQLINYYNVSPRNIKIMYRGIDNVFSRNKRNIEDNVKNIELIYIGSIKKQKNNIDSLKVVKKLIEKGFSVVLHQVGKIQDIDYYTKYKQYINENNLQKNIIEYTTLNKIQINDLLQKCNICISTSNWETFGRGVVEAAFTGIPTIAYRRVQCFSDMFSKNKGVLLVDNYDEMSIKIIDLLNDIENYTIQSIKALSSTECFTSKNIDKEILINITGGCN